MSASNDVNEKSYILDAKKNFEDVSKASREAISPRRFAQKYITNIPALIINFRFLPTSSGARLLYGSRLLARKVTFFILRTFIERSSTLKYRMYLNVL